MNTLSHLADSTRDRPGRWLAAYALLLCTQIGSLPYVERDACVYLSAARSLATTGAVESLGRPGFGGVTAYPLLIAPAFLAGDHAHLLLSAVQVALGVVTLLGVYVWARRVMPEDAVLLTGAVVLSAMFLIHVRRPLKDVAVLALLVWTINAMHAALRAPSVPRAFAWGLVGGVAQLGVTSLRVTTVVFAAAFVGLGAWTLLRRGERRRTTAAVLAGFAVPCLLAGAFLLGRSSTTVDHVRTRILQAGAFTVSEGSGALADGIRREVSELGQLTIPGLFKAYTSSPSWLHPTNLMYLAWFGVLAAAWWHCVRRGTGNDVFLLGAPLYVFLYAAWPFDQGGRFMVVVLPALMACAWVALTRMGARRGLLFAFVVAHAGVGFGHWLVVDRPRAVALQRDWERLEELAASIPDDQRGAGAALVDWRLASLLQLELDRPVRGARAFAAGEVDPSWLLVPADLPAVDGFTPVAGNDRFALLSRAAPATRLSRAGDATRR